MTVASKTKTLPENSPEEGGGFVYAAVEVFSIISPYVFHTHAPRVFSEISAALKRAQEASAEVLAQLNASEKAQARERELRTVEVNRHLSQLKELQALLKARADKEAEINSLRTSIERKLLEEKSRSADLEKRLAESDGHIGLLQEEFVMAKIALDERWRCTMAAAVAEAKEAGREEVAAKVEASMLKRIRTLSSENSNLKAELKACKAQSTHLQETVLSRFKSPDSERTSSISPRASSRASGSKFSFASRESSPGGPKVVDAPALPPLLRRVSQSVSGGGNCLQTAIDRKNCSKPAPVSVTSVMGPEVPELEVGLERQDSLRSSFTVVDSEEGPMLEAAAPEHSESKSSFAEAVIGLTERGSGLAGKVLGFAERGMGIFPGVSGVPEDEKDSGESRSQTTGGKEAVAPGGIGRGASSLSSSSTDLRVRQLRRIATWAKAGTVSRSKPGEHDRRRSTSMSPSVKRGALCQDEHGVRRRGLGAFPHIARGPRSTSCGRSVDSPASVSGAERAYFSSGLLGNEPDNQRPHSYSASSSPLPSLYASRGSTGGRAGRRWQRSLGAGSTSPTLEALLASGSFNSDEGRSHGRGRGPGAGAPLPVGPRRRVGARPRTANAGGRRGDAGVRTATVHMVAAPSAECDMGMDFERGPLLAGFPSGTGAVRGEGYNDFGAGVSPASAANGASGGGGDCEREVGDVERNSIYVSGEFSGDGTTTRPHSAKGRRGSGSSMASAGSRDGKNALRTATTGSRSASATSEAEVPDSEKSLDDLLRDMAVTDVEEDGGVSDCDAGVGGAWVSETGKGVGLEGEVGESATEDGAGLEAALLKTRGRPVCV